MLSAERSQPHERSGPAASWIRMADEETVLGLRPRPRDLALWCQSRMEEGGIVPPHSVLAPGTALGSLPSRALSSAQAKGIVVVRKLLSHGTKQRGDRRNQESARLFDLSCPSQLEIPPVWANSSRTVDAAVSARNGRSQAARRVGWSGPYGEEFAPDKSASAIT